MIVISFDAECVNQNTAPEIANLSRDDRFCVGITGNMTQDQREILEAQHVPVQVPGEQHLRIAPPLLLWSRLLPGDDKVATLRKVDERVTARQYWHVDPKARDLTVDARGWVHMNLAALIEKVRAA